MKPPFSLAAIALLAIPTIRPSCAQQPAAAILNVPEAGIEALQSSQAALNPQGLSCTLSTADGRARFYVGERIRVLAGFSAHKADQYRLDVFLQSRPAPNQFGSFSVAPRAGVADPLSGVPAPQGFGFSGNIPAPESLRPEPYSIALDLNEWLRFDRPGVYRVFFSTNRVSTIKPGASFSSGGFFGAGGLSVASNILQLEIVPAEPGWQQEQARETLHKLAEPVASLPQADRDGLSKTLRFGNARPFALAMIERLSRDDRPRSWPSESSQYQAGLLALPDRDWLIAQMIAAQARPDYAVSESFLGILDTLQAMREAPPPVDAAEARLQVLVSGPSALGEESKAQKVWRERFYKSQARFEKQDWLRLSGQVEPKQGAVQALSLHSLLDKAWHTEIGAGAQVQQKVPRLAQMMAPLLDLLPTLPLDYVLRNDWPRLRHDAQPEVLLKALERLWAQPNMPSQGREFDLADLVIRRISELSPARGRELILSEIESIRPRASISALKMLPQVTLPELDSALLSRLTNPGPNGRPDVAAQLIERYGTSDLAAPVAAWMRGKMVDWNTSNALLAFLLRANEAEGLSQLNALLDKPRPGRDDSPYGFSLLHDVGAVRWSPALQRVALARLGDSQLAIAADAAHTLSSFGSPETKDALYKSLRDNTQSQHRRDKMEPVLVAAIAQGESWLADANELKALAASCRTQEGRGTATQYLAQRTEPSPALYFDAGGNGYWNVAGMVGNGEEMLRKRLAQFPRGTVFKLQSVGFGGSAEESLRGLRAFLQARGMSLQAAPPRHVTLNPR